MITKTASPAGAATCNYSDFIQQAVQKKDTQADVFFAKLRYWLAASRAIADVIILDNGYTRYQCILVKMGLSCA